MKIVHLNKKNLEREEAIQRMAKEIGEKRSNLVMKQYLKAKAKKEIQDKMDAQLGIPKPDINEILRMEAQGRALLELAKEMRKRL